MENKWTVISTNYAYRFKIQCEVTYLFTKLAHTYLYKDTLTNDITHNQPLQQ